jgi:hypothetical protein
LSLLLKRLKAKRDLLAPKPRPPHNGKSGTWRPQKETKEPALNNQMGDPRNDMDKPKIILRAITYVQRRARGYAFDGNEVGYLCGPRKNLDELKRKGKGPFWRFNQGLVVFLFERIKPFENDLDRGQEARIRPL